MRKLSIKLLLVIVSISISMNTIFSEFYMVSSNVPAANWQDEGIPEPIAPNAENVFEIYTAEQLAFIAQKVNSVANASTFADYTVKLMNDIDLSSREWTPIGGWNGSAVDDTKKFCGKFDGNYKKITGLHIGDEEISATKFSYVGLFGYAQRCVIKDLKIENVYINSTSGDVGGLVGYFDNSYSGSSNDSYIISNCFTFSGSVCGRSAGGLIGEIHGGKIVNCGSDLQATGYYTCGGLIGDARGDVKEKIINCYASGDVKGKSAGGLIGMLCYGNVTNCYASGAVLEDTQNYGLIGTFYYGVTKYVNFCYYNADADNAGSGETNSVAGIYGLSAEKLRSVAFVDVLNENSTIDGAMWCYDENNINNGFPTLSNSSPNPFKWTAYAENVVEKDNVFEVYTAEQLAWISLQVSKGMSFAGKTVKLMNDIDLTGKEWVPIGGRNGGTTEFCYGGNFDGNFKTIRGLSIGAPQRYNADYDCVGLFGSIDRRASGTPKIQNVGLKDVRIYCRSIYVGALLGKDAFHGSEVKNCYAAGEIHVLNKTNEAPYVGGLIGYGSNGSIRDCYSVVNITCGVRGTVGGLVGIGENIVNCYSSCELESGEGSSLGEIAGSADMAENTFWNKENACVLGGFPVADGAKKGLGRENENDKSVGKTSADLKEQSTYFEWDFENIWRINPKKNNSMPYLQEFNISDDTDYVIQSIKITDVQQQESVLPWNGEFFVNVKIKNNTDIVEERNLCIAVFDRGGRFMETKIQNISMSPERSECIIASFEGLRNTYIGSIKVFVWDDFQGIIPFSDYYGYTL